MLSKGSFALYYGGGAIVPLLSDGQASLLTPCFIFASVVLQLAAMLIIRAQARMINPLNRITGQRFLVLYPSILIFILDYQQHLRRTVLIGVSNIYNTFLISILGVSAIIGLCIHLFRKFWISLTSKILFSISLINTLNTFPNFCPKSLKEMNEMQF